MNFFKRPDTVVSADREHSPWLTSGELQLHVKRWVHLSVYTGGGA